ncbi:MAG: hypothetical protein HQL66_05350 [Magnetococcales bacterium]|nr:hypothetical protein [Magnetococcales bacterium]
MNNDVGNLTNALDTLSKFQQELAKSAGTAPGADGSTFMGFSMTGIAASLAFSIIGLAFYRYGRRSGPTSTVVYGVLLMVFPYFVNDTAYIIGIGALLCILPFVLKFG